MEVRARDVVMGAVWHIEEPDALQKTLGCQTPHHAKAIADCLALLALFKLLVAECCTFILCTMIMNTSGNRTSWKRYGVCSTVYTEFQIKYTHI
jgi:hypothetical protein